MELKLIEEKFWPSFIWHTIIDKNLIDNKKIESEIYLEKTKNPGEKKSNRGGWQSRDFDEYKLKNFQYTEILKLVKFIKPITEQLFLELKIKEHYPRALSNLWMNVNQKSHYNVSHVHPDSILSGVYYVNAPENCGNIVFDQPSEKKFFLTQISHTLGNNIWQEPVDGKLIIFPSWLEHRVESNLSDFDRISISFNVY